MRQPSDDRALYLRQLRTTVATAFLPELTSATAIDAAGLVDRILAEFIVEEEWADALSQEFGAEFEALLGDDDGTGAAPVTPSPVRRAPPPGRRGRGATGRQRCRRRSELCRRLVDVERRFLERVDELRRAVLRRARTKPKTAS